MVSCESQIVKILLGIFNLVWMVLGGGIIYIGVRLIGWDDDFGNAAKLADINLKSVSFVILAIGIVIILVSFCGFFGACCENACLLNLFGTLMILLIVAEGFAIGYSIVNKTDINDEIANAIQKAIKEISNNTDTALVLEELQYNVKCCGWNGPIDYPNKHVLASCCGTKPEKDNYSPHYCTPSDVTPAFEGCRNKLKLDLITTLFGSTIGVCAAVILFELILVFAACCLAKDIRNR